MTPIYLLGNERRLRDETIDALHLQAGQSVLEVACGTGRNFPLILEKIGRDGKLVGVDATAAILAKARERVERAGWKNVELVQADAARISFPGKFDAAVCTLAVGVIPDHRGGAGAYAGASQTGRLAGNWGSKRSSLSSGRPFNWLADLLGYGAAEEMTRRPWEWLRETLDDFHYKEWFSGFFYAAGGSARK